MLCISSEVVVGLKREKVSKIKAELFSNYTELTNLKLMIADQSQREHLDNEIINDKSKIELYSIGAIITDMILKINILKYSGG